MLGVVFVTSSGSLLSLSLTVSVLTLVCGESFLLLHAMEGLPLGEALDLSCRWDVVCGYGCEFSGDLCMLGVVFVTSSGSLI